MGEQPVRLFSRMWVDALSIKVSRLRAIRRVDCAARSIACGLSGCPAVAARFPTAVFFCLQALPLKHPFQRLGVYPNVAPFQLRAQFVVRQVAIVLKPLPQEVRVIDKPAAADSVPLSSWLQRACIVARFDHTFRETLRYLAVTGCFPDGVTVVHISCHAFTHGHRVRYAHHGSPETAMDRETNT
jgi:hypothetical protein